MKKSNIPTCPGCSRHCPACSVRCKYGRQYFQKHPVETKCDSKKHKWERYVTEGEMLWNLLAHGKKIKKALCHQQLTESALLSLLSEEEKAAVSSALQKLSAAAEAASQK
ncbi:MAG: hypothetical protein J6K55_04525 [Clostridia bacterium]|nr:hypothetical protein [Clostridia bacterium]